MKHLILMMILALGVSAQATTETLSLSMLGAPAVSLLNASSRSCRQQIAGDPAGPDDMGPVSAVLRRFSFAWTGNQPLSLMWVRFRFESPQISGGRFDSTISGSDLGYLFENPSNLLPSDSISTLPSCFLSVGNIPVSDKNRTFTGQGKITIYGTSPKDGQDVPVTGEISFPFRFFGAD